MRKLEIIIDSSEVESVNKLLSNADCQSMWRVDLGEGKGAVINMLVNHGESAAVFELLQGYIDSGKCRVVLYAPEAVVPRPENEEPAEGKKESATIKLGKLATVSKDELWEDVSAPVKPTLNFIAMVVFSSLVAGIGILKENDAVVIGAMVIAPFLGPNLALSMGTTLGDVDLTKRGVQTGVIATLFALGISVLWGFFDEGVQTIFRDYSVGYRDVFLASFCGFAGVISMLSGRATALVGVMVAAALLPPLMRGGLFLGGGLFYPALTSFVIFAVNIICLNIAGILTFYAAGIRPSKWWEKERARLKMRKALLMWAIVLAVLIAVIWLIRYYRL